MKIKLRKEVAEAIGLAKLHPFGLTDMGWSYQNNREIDIALLPDASIDALAKLLERHKDGLGVKMALHDIRIWKSGRNNPKQWARNIKQLAPLLKSYLEKIPGHRLFKKVNDNWLCYYANEIVFHAKEDSRNGVVPAHVDMFVIYEQLGGRKSETIRWWDEDTRRISPIEALARHGFYVETDDFRKMYLGERERFLSLQPNIGCQLDVCGKGSDNLDGNKEDDEDRYWRRDINWFVLGTPDEPARAVVDVFREKAKDREDEDKVRVNLDFWKTKSVLTESTTDDELDEDEQEAPEVHAIEIPVHPILATFDLKRHLRLRLHVNDCRVHIYDPMLADKLVLRPELKALIKLLIEHKEGGFQDIVTGKSGGAVVMLCGPPGTGKTLTAEVYAESEQRALYSVQCSQLGTNPSELEEALLKCFARAKRLNVVMLLDEADVYVHRRGDSLDQNAIVGVFLRVLEYQRAVLFLTTNRPEDVDDAVSSRCVARLVYTVPEPADQERIWAILAETSGITIQQATVQKIVKNNPKLSGRDVKNLLKLAMLMAKGKPITFEQVEFVKQFKPTEDLQ